ncbi:MAG: class I SAM-dependent methyltransferase [Alphaproteobacteria bacterium]|nr:class I SAM-dependent methyltransferase [Alphaproteobacteria bacterium]
MADDPAKPVGTKKKTVLVSRSRRGNLVSHYMTQEDRVLRGAYSDVVRIKIVHPPDFRPRYGYGEPANGFIAEILAAHDTAQAKFIEHMAAHRDAFAAIPLDGPDEGSEPYWNQNWFSPLDGMSLYTVLTGEPAPRYIEIGSGNSTKFARRAIRDQGLRTAITSIDPSPRAEISDLADHVEHVAMEDLDPAFFDRIAADDVVFIDGSHHCLQNSDVTAFFLDVLPRLKAGTRIGIHDIFWPNDYPPSWVKRHYNEQYVLGAYMLAFGEKFPLVFSCAYAGVRYEERIKTIAPPGLEFPAHGIGGGCLWFRKPSGA